MTGGTRKRGATWSYYFDLGKVNGKRQKKEKGGFKTKKEAEAALAQAITEYNNAGNSETFALTWDDIDFDKRTITVSKQVVIKRNFGMVLKTIKRQNPLGTLLQPKQLLLNVL